MVPLPKSCGKPVYNAKKCGVQCQYGRKITLALDKSHLVKPLETSHIHGVTPLVNLTSNFL